MRVHLGLDSALAYIDVAEERVVKGFDFIVPQLAPPNQVREAGKYTTVVTLKLRWQGFETIIRQSKLLAPKCDDFTFRAGGLSLLDKTRWSNQFALLDSESRP